MEPLLETLDRVATTYGRGTPVRKILLDLKPALEKLIPALESKVNPAEQVKAIKSVIEMINGNIMSCVGAEIRWDEYRTKSESPWEEMKMRLALGGLQSEMDRLIANFTRGEFSSNQIAETSQKILFFLIRAGVLAAEGSRERNTAINFREVTNRFFAREITTTLTFLQRLCLLYEETDSGMNEERLVKGSTSEDFHTHLQVIAKYELDAFNFEIFGPIQSAARVLLAEINLLQSNEGTEGDDLGKAAIHRFSLNLRHMQTDVSTVLTGFNAHQCEWLAYATARQQRAFAELWTNIERLTGHAIQHEDSSSAHITTELEEHVAA